MNTATTKKIPPPDEFTANFKSADFSGTIKFRHMSETEISFFAPSSVKGLKFTILNGKTTIKYSDMLFESDGGEITQTSFGNAVVNAISDLIVNNETVEATEENGFIKRTGKDYIICQNKESGAIAEVNCKNYSIRFIQK